MSLANVLHQTRYSNEAAIVIHAAIDISRELNVNHFTLGNIYAVSILHAYLLTIESSHGSEVNITTCL